MPIQNAAAIAWRDGYVRCTGVAANTAIPEPESGRLGHNERFRRVFTRARTLHVGGAL